MTPNYIQRAAALGAAFFILSGCSHIPLYEFQPGEQSAKVTMIGAGQPWICKNHQVYSVPQMETNGSGWSATRTFQVPAGERIQLSSYMYFAGYNVRSSCMVRLSFIPRPDLSYVANASLKSEGCEFELVREDSTKDAGLSLEPSVGGAYCGN